MNLRTTHWKWERNILISHIKIIIYLNFEWTVADKNWWNDNENDNENDNDEMIMKS